jgi:hypothetical protein
MKTDLTAKNAENTKKELKYRLLFLSLRSLRSLRLNISACSLRLNNLSVWTPILNNACAASR